MNQVKAVLDSIHSVGAAIVAAQYDHATMGKATMNKPLDASVYGTKVELYFNLHRKCWSVRSMASGLVVGHVDSATLTDVVFKVSEAGRQRVLREGRKNVHAVARGTLFSSRTLLTDGVDVTYNPYKYASFVVKSTGEAVHSAKVVQTSGRQVLAWGIHK